MNSKYKIAIQQGEALFFLSFSPAMDTHYGTRVEAIAEWFPTKLDAITAMHRYCMKTFRGQLSMTPIVLIKKIECPIIKKEVHENLFDPLDYSGFD